MLSAINMSHEKMSEKTELIKLLNFDFHKNIEILDKNFDKKTCGARFEYAPWKNV